MSTDPCAVEDRSNNHTAKVFLFVPDPEGTLDAGYDRIIVERSRDRSNGPWKQALRVDKGIEIQADVYNYVFIEEDSQAGWFYRPVLVSSYDEGLDPLPQAVREAVDTSFEAILTVEELRSIYLFGVDLTDDSGRPYPAELFAHYIRGAIAHLEHLADLTLLPTKIVERKDWYRQDWLSYGFLKLLQSPVISVSDVRIEYPDESSVLVLPASSIRLDRHAGHLQFFPPKGSYLTQAGAYLPFVLGGASFIPGIWKVTYFAGFELGKIPANIKEWVGLFSAVGPLNIAGDLVAGAGIMSKSLSVDGLSESLSTTNSSTNAGYGARLLEYRKSIKPIEDAIKKFYNGAKLSMIA